MPDRTTDAGLFASPFSARLCVLSYLVCAAAVVVLARPDKVATSRLAAILPAGLYIASAAAFAAICVLNAFDTLFLTTAGVHARWHSQVRLHALYGSPRQQVVFFVPLTRRATGASLLRFSSAYRCVALCTTRYRSSAYHPCTCHPSGASSSCAWERIDWDR